MPKTPNPRYMSAEAAMEPIRSGMRLVIGSGAAQPQELVRALCRRCESLDDVEVMHLLTLGIAPYAKVGYKGGIRHNALFIGANVRDAVRAGLADYTPAFLSEIPELFRSERIPVDAALVQVSPPRNGKVSLGIAVDILKAAVDSAQYVVAQVNPNMPWTRGDSLIDLSRIDALVEHEEPVLEMPPPAPTAEALWIGRHVSKLIDDGATLQMGIGAIPDAVLASLHGKKNLSIHSEMISDGVLALLKAGVVRGTVVTSFCFGSRELYDAVDDDPRFEFRPTEEVNDPFLIARHENMVSVNSALEVDLTGQVCAESIGGTFYSGFGGQIDFIRGAARARNGRAVLALPATAKNGSRSRITCQLSPGAGVVTTRADVDFVVTEYGIAHLKGKTIRERALALIGIAHPKFRASLAREAAGIGYIDPGHVLPPAHSRYDVSLEMRRVFGDLDVQFRPLKPTDEKHLKRLFYTQSEKTTLMRFGIPLKTLSERQFQELVSIDYRNSMAIGAFVKTGRSARLVGVARYYAQPDETFAEAAVTVHDAFQGRGLGRFLFEYLGWIAKEHGLRGFTAELTGVETGLMRMLESAFERVQAKRAPGGGSRVTVWFGDRPLSPERPRVRPERRTRVPHDAGSPVPPSSRG